MLLVIPSCRWPSNPSLPVSLVCTQTASTDRSRASVTALSPPTSISREHSSHETLAGTNRHASTAKQRTRRAQTKRFRDFARNTSHALRARVHRSACLALDRSSALDQVAACASLQRRTRGGCQGDEHTARGHRRGRSSTTYLEL